MRKNCFSNREIKKIIEKENNYWSRVFKEKIEKDQQKSYDFSSYWWECYFSEITEFVNLCISRYKNPHILEAGSGSGKASILLGKNLKRTLVDISMNALEYAKYIAKKFNAKNIEYVNGNIFALPFEDKTFDLAWNIGVIEHYKYTQSVLILREMIRVTKQEGKIAIGVPNFMSGPIIKARILKHPILRFVPGYRLGTEHRYTEKKLIDLFRKAAQHEKRRISNFEIKYFGNPLPIETPRFLLTSLGKMIEYLLPKNKFLLFVICDIE
ncbi:MAG: class I SAM-dependent methyltransferase [bacterium]